MMSNNPEKNPAPQTDADADAQNTPDAARPDVEDLIPGLGDVALHEQVADLEAQVAALTEERDQTRDRMLRALAEVENIRRRAERDRKDAEAYGGTRLARDLLSVHDNLARTVAAADEDLRTAHAGFFEGVELTQRELLNAFGKHKIAPIHPEAGEKFDPNRHQAMFEAPIPGAEPGTVIEVMQSGFMISDRLLRPALVGVAKTAPPTEAPADNGDEPTA
jgi:molecular chaperone GrpE